MLSSSPESPGSAFWKFPHDCLLVCIYNFSWHRIFLLFSFGQYPLANGLALGTWQEIIQNNQVNDTMKPRQRSERIAA